MGYHHLALAARDMQATHRFYSEVLGFTLVKAQAAPTPERPGAWAKHIFYATNDTGDTSDGMIAFWELHDEKMAELDTAISTGLGFEAWVNHIAFGATDLEDIERRKNQWLGAGYDVVEINHDFCLSIYTVDPNGILVEFCTDLAPYTDADRAEALAILNHGQPELENPPVPVFHLAAEHTPTPA
jgi:catechol 2,3-dioxygenase-like lactoylglutathione lyase family enzyme